jgi:hypothetical protein
VSANPEESSGEPTAGVSNASGEEEEESIQGRLDAFPWASGVVTGAVSFLVGYLLIAAYVVVGPATLPGTVSEQLRRAAFLFYNAQNILVVAETGPDVNALPINLLPQATLPILYQAVPVVVLLLASAVVTTRVFDGTTDGVAAIATGMALSLGYLAAALVGTYVFTLAQGGVVYHPDRPTVFVFGLASPLVVGIVGSVISQTLLSGRDVNGEPD